ncbi:MAG: ABC transporter permease [Bacteroidales bacterium]|nr:ABC transporter permease [Bacteroidales bacterium]
MNLPLRIARRYLLAKKSFHIINIISIISLVGISVGVMALVIVLSVFNGFEGVIKGMYSRFDADIKILPAEGKTFSTQRPEVQHLLELPSLSATCEVVEENALLAYGSKRHIGTIKGVGRSYASIAQMDSCLRDGRFRLWMGSQPFITLGLGVAQTLNASLAHFQPITVYIPKRGKAPLSMEAAFEQRSIMPTAVFSVQADIDMQYAIAPVEFVRKLLGYDSTAVSALELRLDPSQRLEAVQRDIVALLGPGYRVLNRYQQNETFYRTMKTEKLVIGLILVLVLIIASFNIVGTLSMLIIDKRSDVGTLRSLGADNQLIGRIFIAEGMLISVGGIAIGTVLGLLLCWAQQTFKLIRLEGRGTFVIDAYPVDVQLPDIAAILALVLLLGYLCARFPVRMLTRRILSGSTI